MKPAIFLNVIFLGLTRPPCIDSFAPSSSKGRRQRSHGECILALRMASIRDSPRRRQRSSSSSSSSSSPRFFPPILRGQSLAHNLHEFVLGVLVNSDGQNILSKQRLTLQSADGPRQRQLRKSEKPASSSSRERKVSRVERFERIPAWPARNGLRLRAISRHVDPDLAARLEHERGGADCPNLWLEDAARTSPFLMMCHHNHSFDADDPLRLLERSVVPEGFPSHAHRGMTSVTFCVRGGLVHRDSLGNKQVFGADENTGDDEGYDRHRSKYNGKHTQWLTFGKGIVHELMWDNERSKSERSAGHRRDNERSVIRQEIYQIWIDLPQSKRYMEPRVELLGGKTETPTIVDDTDGNGRTTVQTTIIAGEHNGISASVDTISDLAILRVEMTGPYRTWTHRASASHSTVIVYVRTGSVTIGDVRVPPHCTAYLSSHSRTSPNDDEDAADVVRIRSEEEGADFLVMSGRPLGQEVAARGSMVAETPEELERAFRDYERGEMGVPWREGSSDERWRRHLMRTKRSK